MTVAGPAAVIFDLDGCLVDSEPLSLGALAEEMRARGMPDVRFERIRDAYLGVSVSDIARDVAAEIGPDRAEGFEAGYLVRLYSAYERDLRPIGPMVELLERLIAAKRPVCIATGGTIERMHRTLRFAGLTGHFEGRAFSAEEVDRGKPAPDLMLYAAERLGVAPEACVVVEDSPHGVAAAMAAGMRAVGFTGGSHLRGISDRHAERLLQAGAHSVSPDAQALWGPIQRGTG